MNLPNALTLSRIVLSPVVVALMFLHTSWGDFFALVVFAGAALTDAFDGRIARSSGMTTQLGRFLDPLADKVLTTSLLVAFVAMEIVPAWMVVVIVMRDLVVTGLRLIAAYRGLVIAPSILARWKTAIQMTAISVIMLFINVRHAIESAGVQSRWGDPGLVPIVALWSVGFCVALTVITAVDYLVKFGRPILRGLI